jgi:predicted ATP-grasp superfamily ATP-dependent carboligase
LYILNRPPAIVLGVTWANGLGLIRSLGQAGVPVLALDPKPFAIGFSSRYVTASLRCPDAGEEEVGFLRFMEQLGQKLPQPGVLFLTRDQDVSAVSRSQSRLDRHFCIPFADWPVLSRIVDKRGQYAVALDVGVPLPETFFPEDETEAALAARKAPYPAIIKPAYHARFSERFAGIKGFEAHNPEETLAHYRRGTAHGYQMMIQEVIPGEPDHLYTYGSYLNRQGEPLAHFTGRKIRQHPRMFGTCRLGECCPAPEVEELALRLLRALDFWGISQVEFKLDPRDGQFKLIEVNARNYQWQHLTTVCGANLAYAAYRDAVGEAVAPTQASAYGKKWVLAASDLVLTPGEILQRQTSLGSWLRSWRGVAVDGIFSWRDMRPGLQYLGNQVARRIGAGS